MKRWAVVAFVASVMLFGSVASANAVTEVTRYWGSNRYTGSAAIARGVYDQDPNTPGTQWPTSMKHVVIASGEDRAAADPLSAAGLCGLYGAPMLLVTSSTVTVDVMQVVDEIAANTTSTVTIHVVGGLFSVPEARIDEIKAYAAEGAGLVSERVLAGGNRYDLAGAIAVRVADSWPGGEPPVAFIANGADPDKFFDALSLSPICAGTGYPILLVKSDDIPLATFDALGEIDEDNNIRLVIGGGPATVNQQIYDFFNLVVPTERWWGLNRYDTALDIANKAVEKGWAIRGYTGVAAKLPDALCGGSVLGRTHGVLVITNGESLTPVTGGWITTYKGSIGVVPVFGGPKSVTEPTVNQIKAIFN